MILQTKSQPAPDCLAIEKAKKSGTYRCDGVINTIKTDFHNKCYICEFDAPISINVEHFVAHQGNRDLEFSWDNLFFACGHCNGIKLAIPAFNNILNCTSAADNVDTDIEYRIDPYPMEEAEFRAVGASVKISNTVTLLEAVFNGTTVLKKIQAANLRAHLLNEIRYFQDLLISFANKNLNAHEKAAARLKIEQEIRPTSNFTAFKRWILRRNAFFAQEFQVELA